MEPDYSSANVSIDYQFITLVLNVEYVVKRNENIIAEKLNPIKKHIITLKLVTQNCLNQLLKLMQLKPCSSV